MHPTETRRCRSSRGFTLLEILVVLVIVGLLIGLVGPRLFGRADAAKVQTAQAQIKLLRGALETMRMDISRYPTQAEGLLLLTTAPSDPGIAQRWRGPYLDDALPSDPWGAPYRYVVPGPGGQAYGIYSYGGDGKPGGEGTDADIGAVPTSGQ
jgi:general secretion pathway protein G